MPTLQYIENSLYNHTVWARMNSGRYWVLRRNGKTQTWKTRPNDYRIPVKCGLKSCGEITHNSSVALFENENWRTADFVITNSGQDPNIKR
jgi:hypothetical protein